MHTVYFWGKNPKKGRIAVFAGVVKDGNLSIGQAECSKKDRFVKKVGRTKAIGRANSTNECSLVPIKEGADLKEMSNVLINYVLNEVKYTPLKQPKVKA